MYTNSLAQALTHDVVCQPGQTFLYVKVHGCDLLTDDYVSDVTTDIIVSFMLNIYVQFTFHQNEHFSCFGGMNSNILECLITRSYVNVHVHVYIYVAALA